MKKLQWDRSRLFAAGFAIRAVTLCFLCGMVAFIQTVRPALAQTETSSKPISVLLSNLPPKDSAKYKYLRDIAGFIGGEALPMSGSEMWLIDPARTDMLMHVCDELSVEILEVGQNFNTLMSRAVSPDGNETPMKAVHETFIKNVMASGIATSVTVMNTKAPAVVEYALGRGEKPMIGTQRGPHAAQDEIQIPLNGTETITAKRIAVYTTQDGCFWHGRIGDTELPVSLMWWPNGRMTGSLKYNGKDYVIKNIEGDTHAVVELDPEKMPPEHPVMPPEFRKRIAPGEATGQQDSRAEDLQNLQDAREANTQLADRYTKLIERSAAQKEPGDQEQITISVLFAYTKNAARHYTDIRKDLFGLAVEQTTQSFRDSRVQNVRVEFAGSYMTDYDEGKGNLFNHLWRAVDRGDGHMEEIHKMRDEHKADIVILVVDSPTGCGLATRIAADANDAFAAVHHDCATTTYSVAHEIGHILGTRHDRSLDKQTRPFPYGHGFANREKWRTMMAYKSSCNNCPRLPIWSSPDVKVAGEAAGDPLTHNARVIAEQAARVARFR